MISVTCVNTQEALIQVAPEWDRLCEEAPTPSVFLTLDWIRAWWNAFPRYSQLRVLLIKKNGYLIAAAPLVIVPLGFRGSPLTVIRFLGHPVADYRDFLLPLRLEDRAESLRAILFFLLDHNREWTFLDLADLPEDSTTCHLLTPLLEEAGVLWRVQSTYLCPYIDLTEEVPRGLLGRDRKSRYNLRRSWRRLEALGKIQIRRYEDPSEVDQLLPQLLAILRQRRSRDGVTTPFFSPMGLPFLREIAAQFLKRGWLDLVTLEVGSNVIAFSYSFIHRGRYYYYLTGYDPVFAAYSPGVLLLAHLIDRVQQEGLRHFDFTKGEEEYKQRWATGTRRNMRLIVAPRGVTGSILLQIFCSYRQVFEWGRKSPTARSLYYFSHKMKDLTLTSLRHVRPR